MWIFKYYFFFVAVVSCGSILPVWILWRNIFSTHLFTVTGFPWIYSCQPLIYSFTTHLFVCIFSQLCWTVQSHGFPALLSTSIVVSFFHHSGSVGVFISFWNQMVKIEYKKFSILVKSFLLFHDFSLWYVFHKNDPYNRSEIKKIMRTLSS